MDGRTTQNGLPNCLSVSCTVCHFHCAGETGTALPFWPRGTAAALDRIPSVNGSRRAASIGRAIEALKALPAMERESRISQMLDSGGLLESSATVDKTMTWAQIAELHAQGVTFGSHTSTHEILTMVPAPQAEQEIVLSRKAIQQKLGGSCELFPIPMETDLNRCAIWWCRRDISLLS